MRKSLYVFSGGELKRKGNTVYFEAEQGSRYLPVEEITDIFVFGEVTINKSFLEFASQKEISVHYFSYHGYYMGTFYPREHYNSGYMTLKQAEHYLEPERRVGLAAAFVQGAAANMRQVLKYYLNRGKNVEEALAGVENAAAGISSCADCSELMAVEGRAREWYYKAFDEITGQADFAFEQRSRRPPRNLLNALISFGNSLIYTIVLSEIYKTHLDPRIGFLHATNFRRFTLNLDVAEVFKPVIVDRLIFSLIDKRIMAKEDFDPTLDGIVLREKGRRTFVEELDKKLKTVIRHRTLNRHVSYRTLIRLELYKLEKHLIGEKKYEPFVASW